MNSNINLMAIAVASFLGIMLSIVTLSASGWRSKNKTTENNLIRYLLMAVLITNIANPIAFYADGYTDILSMLAIRFADFWVYFANILIGYLWWYIVAMHINKRIGKLHRIIVYVGCIASTILLFVNCFIPIVYYFDEQNVYHRGTLAPLYTVIELLFAFDGIVLYLLAKKDGGVLKFFPVWQFVLPVVVGTLIQQRFYGITLTIPCMSISALGIVLGLKNTRLFGDQLTQTYNRFYLNYVKKRIERRKSGKFTLMMLDLNDFKSINDSFGHAEGDAALIQTAAILCKVVGILGSVIRYAGDEFVIILNTEDSDMTDSIVAQIKDSFAHYNAESEKPYQLSISIGYCAIDLKTQTVDEVMNEVDRYMYEDKKVYYANCRRRESESNPEDALVSE